MNDRRSYVDLEARNASFCQRVSWEYCMNQCTWSFFLTIETRKLHYRCILESETGVMCRRNNTWKLLKVFLRLTGDLFCVIRTTVEQHFN